MVQRIKNMKELKELFSTAGDRLIVIEYSARWCGPCKTIAPVFRAMSLKYKNVIFARVDVDASQELAQHFNIKVVPTFQMFKHTQKVTPFSRLKRILCCLRSGPKFKKHCPVDCFLLVSCLMFCGKNVALQDLARHPCSSRNCVTSILFSQPCSGHVPWTHHYHHHHHK
ncbi:thioredoxin domain-containing protein 8-like isoform X2 [Mastomys coucha]|uniref:thioredoxin domain-containing protein 8-like isoform X2 n=1 Tax=Mastomys coucha TaxID=35658 RepID=UPI00126254FD|nr:thioredoxin domain-containing protein 8-like isoform X2 [Mastomys coucha]